MRLCGRLPLIVCLLIALVAGLLLGSARATGDHGKQTPCTSGASSIRAEVVDGRLVVSQPATSGCIP